MTDIVERLRAVTLDRDNFPNMDSERKLPVALAKEAAGEVERLRANNAAMRAVLKQVAVNFDWRNVCAGRLHAEIQTIIASAEGRDV